MPGYQSAAAGDNTIRLHDGRTLGFVDYGPPGGKALLYFHGHPGARLEARFLAGPSAQLGVRLIGIDRPGMGLSSFQAGRRLLDWPEDVVELADYLKLDRFAVVGFSGGGPYALACAYQIPQRLTSCGIVAGVGHINPFLRFLSQWAPWILLPITQRFFQDEERAQETLERFAASWVAPDRQSFVQPGVKALMAASLVEAQRQGASGAAYDGTLLGRAWGFRPGDIKFPCIHLWHGERDDHISVAAGRALAASLPGCEATFYPDEGHISLIVSRAQTIVKTLMDECQT
jgi:pimeloyl-ACP methyl ester carboxylesterase